MGMNRIESLLTAIRALPGPKILTLTTSTGLQPYDMHEDGTLGYDPGHGLLFQAKLVRALHEGGALIVRQFLPIKVEHVAPDGRRTWIPRKNVYAIKLGQQTWTPLSAKDTRTVCCTDAETGQPLPPEPTVSYLAFPSHAPGAQ